MMFRRATLFLGAVAAIALCGCPSEKSEPAAKPASVAPNSMPLEEAVQAEPEPAEAADDEAKEDGPGAPDEPSLAEPPKRKARESPGRGGDGGADQELRTDIIAD